MGVFENWSCLMPGRQTNNRCQECLAAGSIVSRQVPSPRVQGTRWTLELRTHKVRNTVKKKRGSESEDDDLKVGFIGSLICPILYTQ